MSNLREDGVMNSGAIFGWCPTDESSKDAFSAQLDREYDRCRSHDVKIVIGVLNAQKGLEE